MRGRRLPVRGVALVRRADVHRRRFSFLRGGGAGPGLDRPALTRVDAAYLRKRKLALDDAFLAASQDIEIDAGAE